MAFLIRCCLCFLIPFSLLFTSCGNSAKKIEKEQVEGEERNEYKRFTGVVAGQQVVVNLYIVTNTASGLARFSGNYFYKGKSQVIDISEAEGATGGEVYLNEFVETENNDEEDKQSAQWRVKIDKDRIKGRWMSADRTTTNEIDLFENYDDAYSFMFIYGTDSVTVNSKTSMYKMQADYKLMIPSSEVVQNDGAFIEQSLGRELGGDTVVAGSIFEYVKAKNKKDFKDYLNIMADIMNEKDGEEGGSNNWESVVMNTCRYNNNGLLVFEVAEYSYTGGAHGFYLSKYVCLDMKARTVLHLEDIITADTARLMAELDTAVRSVFKIAPGEALSERLLVDTIPLTRNVAISDIGITFYYNVYEIASYADGQKCIFLPYARIEDLLKPEFKERMGL